MSEAIDYSKEIAELQQRMDTAKDIQARLKSLDAEIDGLDFDITQVNFDNLQEARDAIEEAERILNIARVTEGLNMEEYSAIFKIAQAGKGFFEDSLKIGQKITLEDGKEITVTKEILQAVMIDLCLGTPPVTKTLKKHLQSVVMGDAVHIREYSKLKARIDDYDNATAITKIEAMSDTELMQEEVISMIAALKNYPPLTPTQEEKIKFLIEQLYQTVELGVAYLRPAEIARYEKRESNPNSEVAKYLKSCPVSGGLKEAESLIKDYCFDEGKVKVVHNFDNSLLGKIQNDPDHNFLIHIGSAALNRVVKDKNWQKVLGRVVFVEADASAEKAGFTTVYSLHPQIVDAVKAMHTNIEGTPSTSQMKMREILEGLDDHDVNSIKNIFNGLFTHYRKLAGDAEKNQTGDDTNEIRDIQNKYDIADKLNQLFGVIHTAHTGSQESLNKMIDELRTDLEKNWMDYFYSHLKGVGLKMAAGSGGGRKALHATGLYMRERARRKAAEFRYASAYEALSSAGKPEELEEVLDGLENGNPPMQIIAEKVRWSYPNVFHKKHFDLGKIEIISDEGEAIKTEELRTNLQELKEKYDVVPGLYDLIKSTLSIVINSPHNPTGKVLSKQETIELMRIAQEFGITLIDDGSYHFMERNDHIPNAAEIYAENKEAFKDLELVVTVVTATKNRACAGYRINAIMSDNQELLDFYKEYQKKSVENYFGYKILNMEIEYDLKIKQLMGEFADDQKMQEMLEGRLVEKMTARDVARRFECFDQAAKYARDDLGLDAEIDYLEPAGAFYVNVNFGEKLPEGIKLLDFCKLMAEADGVKASPIGASGRIRFSLGDEIEGTDESYEQFTEKLREALVTLKVNWDRAVEEKSEFMDNHAEEARQPEYLAGIIDARMGQISAAVLEAAMAA